MTQINLLVTIWPSCNVRHFYLMPTIDRTLLLVNKESWEKFEEQKNSLTMAIDEGEREKNDIKRV